MVDHQNHYGTDHRHQQTPDVEAGDAGGTEGVKQPSSDHGTDDAEEDVALGGSGVVLGSISVVAVGRLCRIGSKPTAESNPLLEANVSKAMTNTVTIPAARLNNERRRFVGAVGGFCASLFEQPCPTHAFTLSLLRVEAQHVALAPLAIADPHILSATGL